MRIAYIKPSFPGEKRVGLLPKHIDQCDEQDERRFEKGYGETLGVSDAAYGEAGGYSRESLFEWAEVIYCIKVPQPCDYASFREEQVLTGWIHPLGCSGKDFAEHCAVPKKLTLFDVTNRISMRYQDGNTEMLNLPADITRTNSILAGYASTMHAITLRGGIQKGERVAVFGTGNVAYGAMQYLSSRGIDPLLRRRSNAHLMKEEFTTYDIFINGVEISDGDPPIISDEILDTMKTGGWFIDAAADAGRSVENIQQTVLHEPIYSDEKGRTFYVVSNSPSLLYRESSEAVSEGYAKYFWSKPMSYWLSDECLAWPIKKSYSIGG